MKPRWKLFYRMSSLVVERKLMKINILHNILIYLISGTVSRQSHELGNKAKVWCDWIELRRSARLFAKINVSLDIFGLSVGHQFKKSSPMEYLQFNLGIFSHTSVIQN